jgi:RNA polymerase sigma-B factor
VDLAPEAPRSTEHVMSTATPTASFEELARSGDPAIRNELVQRHLGLAHHLARRFRFRADQHDDLVQVASIALINAVDRFDPSRGVAFSTFATKTIIGELKHYLRDRGWVVRTPRRLQELSLEIAGTVERLTQVLGRPPTVLEIAANAGITEEEVLEGLEAGQAHYATSVDHLSQRSQRSDDPLGVSDTGFELAEDRETIAAAIECLPERSRAILHLRFVEGMTQSQIAERMGISQMHVSRLLTQSLAKLRTVLDAADH